MRNTSECIAETLSIGDDSKRVPDSSMENILPANTENSKRIDEESYLRKNSSFKQVCEFPITVCRRGSKDIISWLNNFSIKNKKSASEIMQDLYNQVQSSLFLFLMCAVLLTISVEACICLFLLIPVILEPGFLFLFSTFVGVGFVSLRILTAKQMNGPKKKIKSKEI